MLRRAIIRPLAFLPILLGPLSCDRPQPGVPVANAAIAGVAVGTAPPLATAAGVAPVKRQTWSHEPQGFVLVSDQPWDGLWSLGWTMQWGDPNITRDETAPDSPPRVLTIDYPRGFAGGAAPATATRAFPPTRGIFTRVWWKASDPWQGHQSNVNKLLFLFPASGGDIALVMYGPPGGPYELRTIPQYPGQPSEWLLPNIARVPVTLGVWHKVEWLVDDEDGAGRGTVQWWLDGVLLGDHRGVAFPSGLMIELKISPTWGGVGDRKRNLDHFWFDHTYVSRRR